MLKQNYSLKKHNTFGVAVKCKYFIELKSIEEIEAFLKEKKYKNLHKLVIGEGSNILFTKDYKGIIIKSQISGIELIKETDEFYYVKVGSGIIWDNFVEYCVEKNWQGVENLSSIPGTVGAAPVQNIGAYGVEIKDVLHSVEYIDLRDGSLNVLSNNECKFAYRDSIFKNELKSSIIVSNVVLKLNKKPVFNTNFLGIKKELDKLEETNIKNIRNIIIKIRNSKLPNVNELGNAGSFFKNPIVNDILFLKLKNSQSELPYFKLPNKKYKIPAAYLIDKCGLKGFKYKNAGIYKNQPLVLVNYGKATGQEIFELSKIILSKVKQKFGIELKREVNVW